MSNPPVDELERKLIDAFGKEAAELDKRAREASARRSA